MCLGQILVCGELVHKGQGQVAKSFGIPPVTPSSIERVMAPDELRPVRRGLALMSCERMDFLLPDRANINVPLGVKSPATPQGAKGTTRRISASSGCARTATTRVMLVPPRLSYSRPCLVAHQTLHPTASTMNLHGKAPRRCRRFRSWACASRV